MEKRYKIEVTAEDFKSLKFEEIVTSETIKERLAEIAPDCNIDFERVFTDARCKFFRHYMPANKTIALNAHKKGAELHKAGNNTKVYISAVDNF